MKNNNEIIIYSNNVYGYFKNGKIYKHDNQSFNEFCKKINLNIIKKNKQSLLGSLVSFLISLLTAILIAILAIKKIINIGLFTYTIVIALCVLLWIIIYYILGIIFYKKETLTVHFKKLGSEDYNYTRYASSLYCNWIDKYIPMYEKTTLYYQKNNKKKFIGFGLFYPKKKIKGLIFNNKIFCNVPYYYFTFDGINILFLPGIVCYINKNKSFIDKIENVKVNLNDGRYDLYIKDELIVSFYSNEQFNINFFNFKY